MSWVLRTTVIFVFEPTPLHPPLTKPVLALLSHQAVVIYILLSALLISWSCDPSLFVLPMTYMFS